MTALPAPEQSGVETAQLPPGVVPAWFSKPSQIAVGTHPCPGLGVVGVGVGVVGVGVGVVGADVVGVGVGVDPLHETPLKVNSPGFALVPEYVPWNPNRAEAPVASDPFHPTLAAVTAFPVCVTVAFQALVTR
ncbi:hypothetical protein Aab01nite_49780 [Paractinoplanes abujensis]|nr:hypothetical protein Aab01nite_49780 [Actinoplanes abujensis]